MDQHELNERADQAKEILNHPLVKECFDALEWRAFEKAVSTTSVDDIMIALQDLRALRSVRSELQTMVSDASISQAATRRRRMAN